jgi:copper(I)-binding protein
MNPFCMPRRSGAISQQAQLIVCSFILLSLSSFIRAAEGPLVAPITIRDAVIILSDQSPDHADVVFEMVNEGPRNLVLTGVSSPVAERAGFHHAIMLGGEISRREVSSYTLPPSGSVKMAAGGLHLVLFNLNESVRPGQVVPVTLRFDAGMEYEFNATVRRAEGSHQHEESAD